MKISELSTDNAADVICRLTPHISAIVSDEDLMTELNKTIDRKDIQNKAQYLIIAAGKITALIPILLDKRKNDVFGILAAINGKSVDEIKAQNIIVTLEQIKEAVQDKDLIDFFKSCMDTVEGE